VKKLAFVLVVAMSIVGGACGGKKPAPQTPANTGAGTPAPDNKMEAPKTEEGGSDDKPTPDTKKEDGGDSGDSGGDGGGEDPCGG